MEKKLIAKFHTIATAAFAIFIKNSIKSMAKSF